MYPPSVGFTSSRAVPTLLGSNSQGDQLMRSKNFKVNVCGGALTLLGMGLVGCAATISQDGLDQRTSAAIGREVGTFTIVKTGEESGGRINYTAKTKDGQSYQCYMYSATGFQKAMSFGQTPNSDAICTQMGKGSSAESRPAATCNGLLKAAGRC